jgi:transcriptional regulator with XRE-family HTH domain
VSVTAPAPAGFGHLLRHWRSVRAKSQLGLACDAETTPRYVSFVETGRAQPSRQMVVRLARALDVPLRERNELLLAAGYAPLYSAAPLSSPLLKRVEQALTSMLGQHEPFPAVVLDRGWQVQRANTGAQRLFGRLFAPPALLDRAHREAIGGVLDRETAELVRDLRGRPDVARLLTEPDLSPGSAPIVDLHFDMAGTNLRFFSVVSTIGAPIDVTAQELRVEAFFPADDQTRDRWTSLEVSERASLA